MEHSHPLGIFIICDKELDTRLEGAKQLGITTAQILAPAADNRSLEQTVYLKNKFQNADIKITVVFCGFEGESYADIPTVKATVGLVPKSTRVERLEEAKKISDFASLLQVDAVGMHIGFIPKDETDADYQELVDLTKSFCKYCAHNNQRVHLETGQETAEILYAFLQNVNCDNLAVNFDPANMILYGSGEPLSALELVGDYVKSVHCKDAIWAKKPKVEWGTETPLGEGDVNFRKFLTTLKKINYSGPLTIEREISGTTQLQDIAKGVELLNNLKKEIELS